MPNREAALRKIFEATGVSARLTEDQKRELLAHLEDAVETKVGAGVPEMDAVGQAFVEMGDLEKIARQFPKAVPPAAVTPEGFLRLWWGGAAEMGYLLLLFFALIEITIMPSFAVIFSKARVPLPGLTLMALSLSLPMREWWPLVVLGLVALGVAIYRIQRWGRWRRAVEAVLVLGGAALCALALAATALPLVSLLEGTWKR
jgi:hypothetical protein